MQVVLNGETNGMPYTIEWINEQKTILLTTYHEGWTWKEFAADAAGPILELFEASPVAVYNIQYLEGSIPFPKLGWSSRISDAGVMGHPKQKAVFVVTDHRLAPHLANIFVRLFPEHADNMILVQTVDDALQKIEQMDASNTASDKEHPTESAS